MYHINQTNFPWVYLAISRISFESINSTNTISSFLLSPPPLWRRHQTPMLPDQKRIAQRSGIKSIFLITSDEFVTSEVLEVVDSSSPLSLLLSSSALLSLSSRSASPRPCFICSSSGSDVRAFRFDRQQHKKPMFKVVCGSRPERWSWTRLNWAPWMVVGKDDVENLLLLYYTGNIRAIVIVVGEGEGGESWIDDVGLTFDDRCDGRWTCRLRKNAVS